MTCFETSQEGTNRHLNTLDQQHLSKPLIYALVMHGILIVLIGWFWQKDAKQKMAELTPPLKHTTIKSYLITSKQYQLQLNKNESLLPAKPIQAVPEQTQAPTAKKPDLKAPILATTTPISPQSKPQQTQASNQVNQTVSTHTVQSAKTLKQAASKYIQQQNNQQFEQLIGSQNALQNNPIGTMSEMDAELDFIELIPKVDTSQPHTLDHKLDPNRIVKQGDYCYRVVDLATQVNPHGWGLGFAEFCGEDKQKQQLTEAINNRVSKVK
ncbi:hypothetical protein K8B83_20045 [Shewanella inventionis]|uniref:Uncharacterized protein n=1 Tax=Shewanella inventionis TaxID=1738770 RepID=A0ABQ1J3M4_9GAMM|nr:hypothetical protein [Shewanella inventionis]MCL1158965.1 hypothetical protein [Shewanella inventionis]UAL43063.1 hypothetical protein K8B83_20045 [Shewanella inventionis]GGB57187.1 hypothetical protein GCM10011607_17200 [Shewanella inventionis]